MNRDTTKSTILVITIGFLFLYIAFSWHWALITSFIIGLTGIISKYLSIKIEWFWMKLAKLLGYIVPNIILTIVFFLVLFPMSVISRIIRRDPLMLSDKYKTYYVEVDREADINSLKKTW